MGAQAFAAQQQVLIAARRARRQRPPRLQLRARARRLLGARSTRARSRCSSATRRSPGVYPVRAAFPASISTQLEPGARRGRSAPARRRLPGFDGSGVTIALLDTGVDRSSRTSRGRVQPGIDIVGGSDDASRAAEPAGPAQLERHGTELAGPPRRLGRARAASTASRRARRVLPIRVAGWQPAANGRELVYARSDQLIAGLDRAVDPNGDGDAHDAARIALLGVAEPFAAFADSPEAQAVAGRARARHARRRSGRERRRRRARPSARSPGPAARRRRSRSRRPTPRRDSRGAGRRSGAGSRCSLDRRVPLLGAVAPSQPVEPARRRPARDRAACRRGSRSTSSTGSGLSLVAGARGRRCRPATTRGGRDAASGRAPPRCSSTATRCRPARSARRGRAAPGRRRPGAAARRAARGAASRASTSASRSAPRTTRRTRGRGRVAAVLVARASPSTARVKPDLAAPGVGDRDLRPRRRPPTASRARHRERHERRRRGRRRRRRAARAGAAGARRRRPREPARRAPRSAARCAGDAGGRGLVDLGATAVGEVAASQTTLGFGPWERAAAGTRRGRHGPQRLDAAA